MPTKTRLDPTAGGVSPPAEQDGALGSGRGDNASSVPAPHASQGDVAGFIDSLGALGAHIKEREAFEAQARRGWARMALLSALFVPLSMLAAGFGGFAFGVAALPSYLTFLSLLASADLTAALACVMFLQAAARPWREAPDSIDRVALRHEDSPLRDRIRITQWILFDSVFSRFAFTLRRVDAVVAFGVFTVSLFATLALALLPVISFTVSADRGISNAAPTVGLVFFLVLVLAAILSVSRAAKQAFALAQHYARQVLAFDADFGGFLPRAERDRVLKVANRAGAAPKDEA